jgi:hypothetical protein
MVKEAIRDLSKLAARKSSAKTSSFSLETLSSLPTYEARRAYCHAQGLKLLGEGTARTAFLLDSTSVLKLAINEAGRDQNEMEAKVKDCTSIKTVFAKILKASPNYDWIVMELVKPLTSDAAFKQQTGLDIGELRSVLTYWYAENMQKARHRQFEPPDYEQMLQNPFVKMLLQIIKECDMLPGDFAKTSSWGIAKGGRLVLIDYGLSKSIYMKHYYG